MKDFGTTLCNADVLIIVPPFAALERPSLAAHLLQACGREAGFHVKVLYANILLASVIGEKEYTRICYAQTGELIGERFFARCAFGLSPLGHNADKLGKPAGILASEKNAERDLSFASWEMPLTLPELKRLEKQTAGWIDLVATIVCEYSYKIVGCTTTFAQTAASIALLNRIKRLHKDVITILGGANCEGEMGRGLLSLDVSIDYIFSGDSEKTFPQFVCSVLAGSLPKDRLIHGEPCEKLDMLPTPAFSEFYEQREQYLPNSKMGTEDTEIPYETSRGCWWGQKQHCTFCGLNGEGMAFRQKSPDRVIEDLHTLFDTYPSRSIIMTDNIMPHDYFRTLLPRLARELPGLNIFYEQKANLSLQHVLALTRAGIWSIQTGIEALSSRLLKRMKKGALARQNLMLLRYARAAGLQLSWNLLWGIPGDEREAYEETLAFIPLLHHLPPPSSFGRLSIDRFSPYFFQAAAFEVKDVRPYPAYYDFLPQTADVERIAYHFIGDYCCGAYDHMDLIHQVSLAVKQWGSVWRRERDKLPELRVCFYRDRYILIDTRDLLGTEPVRLLDRDEAAFLLTAGPYSSSTQEAWALEQKLAVVVDDWFVPLAVAAPKILLEFESEQKKKGLGPKNSS